MAVCAQSWQFNGKYTQELCMASMLGYHETEKQTALIKCWMATMNLKLMKNSDVVKLFNSYSKVKSILNFAIGNHSSEYKQKCACKSINSQIQARSQAYSGSPIQAGG